MDGQAHYIKVGADNFFNGNHADKILCAIGPGFVVRLVVVNIKINFLRGKFSEGNLGGIVKTYFFLC